MMVSTRLWVAGVVSPTRDRSLADRLLQQVRACSAVAAFTNTSFDVTGVEEPYRVAAARVSANFFATLGIQPAQGRDFTLDDDQPAADPVAILSHGLWLRRFGGNPDLIGQSIRIDGPVWASNGTACVSSALPRIKTVEIRYV